MKKKYIVPKAIVIYIITLVIFLLVAEGIARMAESKTQILGTCIRENPILGWDNQPGSAVVETKEFKYYLHVNSYGMNDRDIYGTEKAKIKIMVVGDSHTFASGVSWNETWPKILEQKLFKNNLEDGVVYNCAVAGYSLGQYLLRIRQLGDTLKPDIIIVGFSMATDLYDLVPPRMGGFVCRSNVGRVYFDLDAGGNLVEKKDLMGTDLTRHILENETAKDKTIVNKIKCFLEQNSALYRRFKRSRLVCWAAINLFKLDSLWPGSSTAVRIDLDKDGLYRWRLAKKLLEKIAEEARENNRKVIVVNIPYLPQAYDKIWQASFGQRPQLYDRFIGGTRLAEICRQAGVYYVDTTQKFIEESRQHKKILYYQYDAHPNSEGHKLIAGVVRDYIVENNLLTH